MGYYIGYFDGFKYSNPVGLLQEKTLEYNDGYSLD